MKQMYFTKNPSFIYVLLVFRMRLFVFVIYVYACNYTQTTGFNGSMHVTIPNLFNKADICADTTTTFTAATSIMLLLLLLQKLKYI